MSLRYREVTGRVVLFVILFVITILMMGCVRSVNEDGSPSFILDRDKMHMEQCFKAGGVEFHVGTMSDTATVCVFKNKN